MYVWRATSHTHTHTHIYIYIYNLQIEHSAHGTLFPTPKNDRTLSLYEALFMKGVYAYN